NAVVHPDSHEFLSEPYLCSIDLGGACFVSELFCQCEELGGACGTDRMALRDETSISVYRNLSSKFSLPFFEKPGSTSRFRKPEILIVQNLGYRERVVNLSNIDIVWTHSGHLVRGFRAVLRAIDACQRTFSSR